VSVTLAESLVHPNLWYPTILGVLVVIAAIGLFCGSIYLLLGTNLGARLGFLVAFTALTGFMVILSLLWTTTSNPLESPKGRVPAWKVLEVVPNVKNAKTTAVRDIAQARNKASSTDAGNVVAAADAALITKVGTPTLEVTPNDNRFAQFGGLSDFLVLQTYSIGGSNPSFWKGEFTHAPKYAVVEYCSTATPDQVFGLPPLPPECDTAQGAKRGFVVLERDLGSMRLPPFLAVVISLILFGLGLLALHWREKDQQALAAAAKATPEPVPARDDSELAKV